MGRIGAIDTLKIYERLKKAELPDIAAKEIAEVIKESSEESVVELVTREHLSQELAQTEVKIIKWVAGMLVAQAVVVATLVKLI